MNATSRAQCCSGLCIISLRDELLSACVAELSAPGTSATDKEMLEKLIRNSDQLRGRAGTNMARAMHYVIGIAVACPVSSGAVVLLDREPSVAKDIVGRNPDLAVAYTSSSNHHVISDCSL
eukprot:7198812-Pyramimonas_sp.AAC.1